MTTHSDDWLTIRQAAERLGLSDLSVRRRIKDGRLAHRLTDGKYYVNLGLEPPGSELLGQAARPDDQSEYTPDQSIQPVARVSDELSSFVPRLAELAQQAGRSSVLEERLREVETREAELQDRLVALATRNGWLESRLDEREQTIKLLEDSRHRRPWWRRVFG